MFIGLQKRALGRAIFARRKCHYGPYNDVPDNSKYRKSSQHKGSGVDLTQLVYFGEVEVKEILKST